MDHFDVIFNPETVAVVGASNALDKWGAGIFSRLLIAPEVKSVYPVNNKSAEVQGVKAYPTVRDLPEEVDFVVIAIPYEGVLQVIGDCAEKGIKAALIITAGLGETGSEGADLERQIAALAGQAGIRLIGPNCMGHFNTANGLSTLRMGMPVEKGGVGVISQSGGFAMHILQTGAELGLGFSKFVSVGNEADLHFEDFLEYYLKDDDTKIITGYIEGLRKGRDFFRVAKEYSKKKPIVVYKVGRTEAGARAARSHTSAIAGSDKICDAMFRQAGVIRVGEVEELFDVAAALLGQPLPRGNRVAILTGGGGFGCVASDACADLGLDVAPLSPSTIKKLDEVLPDRWPHGNPVDTVASGWVTYPCIWPLLEDENFDALMVLGGIGQMGMRRRMMTDTSSFPSHLRAQADEAFKAQMDAMDARQNEELENIDKIIEYRNKYQKPVILTGNVTEDMRKSPAYKKLSENGITFQPTPERGAKVLAHLVRYSRYVNDW